VNSVGEWGLLGIAFVLGAALGCLLTLRAAQARHDAKLGLIQVELTKRHAAAFNELRAAHARAQGELDQARASFKRQLASVAEAPRAAAQRAEERLQAAYNELDRLRAAAAPPERARPVSSGGFAATEVEQR
jgi:septal ring factor EnvC (AmiA/AmiB activator)